MANADIQWMVEKMNSLIGTLRYSQEAGLRTNIPGGYCDCSGLVWWLYNQRGHSIGTWTGSQINDGKLVKSGGGGQACTAKDLQLGDLVLFDWESTSFTTYGHVEMYMGGDQICGHGGVPYMGPVMKSLAQQTSYANAWQVRRILDGGGSGLIEVPPAEGKQEADGTWSGFFYTIEGDRVHFVHGFCTEIERGVIDVSGGDYISRNAYLTMDEMTVNARYIMRYLTARGWTKQAVCGMLGNMQSESTINPGIWESLAQGNLSGGYGIVQWTPASKYIDWARASGLDPDNLKAQLDRIIWEKDNGQQWIATGNYPMSFAEFSKSTQSPNYLAMAFLANYERPLEPYQPVRGSQADYWANIL